MPRIDPATQSRILDTADIVDVVSDFVKLKRRGSGYIGLCPFHNERTPSFSVSPARNFCKCFSCGKGGSPVGFIMEVEKLSFHEALLWLARKYHIEVKERELTDEERAAETERDSLMAINEWALKQFSHYLTDTSDGRDIGLAYFLQRGISQAMIERFKLGYCLDTYETMTNNAITAGYTARYLVESGLSGKTDSGKLYDKYRGRVIFPILSVSGRPIGFGGRTLRTDKNVAKYINSPQSIVYNKSAELYGLYQAKGAIQKADMVYLVEGYFDVISMYQSGVENVVASSGTSLTTDQIRLISRFTRNVTVVYDSDAAGIKASLRGIDMLLSAGLDIKVLQFPEGEDPDSYARTHTPGELESYLRENPVDFMRFKTRILLDGAAGSDPLRRAEAISDICRSISVIPDLIKRTVYIGEAARSFGLDEKVLALQVARITADKAEKDRIESKKEAERAALQDTIQSAQQQQQQQQQQQPAATSATPTKQQATTNYLEPFEHEVIRYVIRYGMVPLGIEDPDSHRPLTVLDFVISEMEYDGISFTSAAVAAVLESARALASDRWPTEEAEYRSHLDTLTRQWQAEAEADIRSRLDQIPNLAAEEVRMREDIAQRRRQAYSDFASGFIMKHLVSSPVDDVRNLATLLATDRYTLSAIHTRYGPVTTERDRLDELVGRAIYEWKDAILDLDIKGVNKEIAEASASATPDAMERVMALMERKAQMLELKRSFARELGERIVSPRRPR